MTIAKNMTAEQFEKLKAENPDVAERAKICTVLTHAFYESIIEFNMSDAEIMGVLVNMVSTLIEGVPGITKEVFIGEMDRMDEIRAKVKAMREGLAA